MAEVAKFESPQAKFVHQWSQGFLKSNLDTITKHLHKDFRSALYPRSLGAAEQSREEFIENMKKMASASVVCYDVSNTSSNSYTAPG